GSWPARFGHPSHPADLHSSLAKIPRAGLAKRVAFAEVVFGTGAAPQRGVSVGWRLQGYEGQFATRHYPFSASFVAKGVDRIEPRGAPGRIKSRQNRQHQSHKDDSAGGP